MTESVTHATFVLERTYDADVQRVFAAWATQKAKARWFIGPEGAERSDHELDFRVGGKEHLSVAVPGGPMYSFDAVYQDIVVNERMVTTYQMHMDGELLSVSVATVELEPVGTSTKLTYTEQGAFLDERDTAAAREEGTAELLDNLGRALAPSAAAAT
jgi:uncharacterized protein YndB with AHSA1/START domain